MTQKSRLLALLKSRGEAGVKVWEIVNSRPTGGLGISQQTARITELRQDGYNIVNVKRGVYVLRDYQKQKSPSVFSDVLPELNVNNQLIKLKSQYEIAKIEKDFVKMNLYKRMIEKIKNVPPDYFKELIKGTVCQ